MPFGARQNHHAGVRKPVAALLVLLGAAASAGFLYLYAYHSSEPLGHADPLAFRVEDGELLIKVGTCVGPSVTRIEVRTSDEVVIDDTTDPVVWSLIPEDGSARAFSSSSEGVTKVQWRGNALDSEVLRVLVSLREKDPKVGDELGAIVTTADLVSGSVVEGRRTGAAGFANYSEGQCLAPEPAE